MHELELGECILSAVLALAVDRRVRRLDVRVGAAQRVDPRSLELGFRMLAEGTLAETASLEVHSVPIRAHCRTCGAEDSDVDGLLICSGCGGFDIAISEGDQVLVDEVEIDDEPRSVIRLPGLAVAGRHHDPEPAGPEAGQHPDQPWTGRRAAPPIAIRT